MKQSQSKSLFAFQRSVSFLDTNASLLGDIPQSAPRKNLDGAIATLAGNVSTQGSRNATKKGLTNQVAVLRTALIVQHMRPIAAIVADKVSDIPQIPDLKAPAASVSSGVLVGLANAMADAATPFAQTFIDDGLPATFLTDLTAAAAALNVAVTTQGTTKGQRVNATQSVTTALRKGRKSLNILSTRVVTALVGNDAMLKEWANVKRVSPKPATPTPAATAATTTTTTPAAPVPTAPAASAPAPTSTQEAKAA